MGKEGISVSAGISTPQTLANGAELARLRLAKAESSLAHAKEKARVAKHRRKEAKQAARRARKVVQEAKADVEEAREAVALAEAKLGEIRDRLPKKRKRGAPGSLLQTAPKRRNLARQPRKKVARLQGRHRSAKAVDSAPPNLNEYPKLSEMDGAPGGYPDSSSDAAAVSSALQTPEIQPPRTPHPQIAAM